MAVMLSCMTAFAQSLTEGFYRVQNKGSQRYLYVRDCTGNISTLGADMDACELWPNLEDAISDPGSVMYLKKYGSSWDITSQATGVHEIVGYYMDITVNKDNTVMVYKAGQYLYEVGVSDFNKNQGLLGAKTAGEMPNKSTYRVWNTPKVDSNTENYFGFKPTVAADKKCYAPFFADFAYTPINNNVKTWYVSQVDKKYGIAVIKEITGTVAKQQAVFVECKSNSTSDNKVDLSTAAGNTAQGNLMKGVFFCNGDRSYKDHPGNPAYVEFDAKTMRILGADAEGKLAFLNTSSSLVTTQVYKNKKWVSASCIPHNQSYLTVDSDCPASLKVMTESEYADYIASVTPPEPEYIVGDVNGDGRVSISDVPSLIMFIIHGDTTGLNEKAADVNGDGRVSIADAPTLVDKIVNKK